MKHTRKKEIFANQSVEFIGMIGECDPRRTGGNWRLDIATIRYMFGPVIDIHGHSRNKHVHNISYDPTYNQWVAWSHQRRRTKG